jgi:uncharacterized membrane protein
MENRFLKIARTFVVLGALGVADAGYLTYLHYSTASPFCSVFNHCDVVLTSPYAVFLGVPVALVGLIYYLALAGLAGAALWKSQALFLKMTGVIAALGFLASLWFLAVQIFILHSFCLYCLFSAALTAAFFVGVLILAKRPHPTV